ncbi:class I SAM-dependent methyltransferase (plasmid) [Azospirillum argentinense]|uniref:Class I SAM-dependent methyltransferase n=1 Tax=Azospirillum argentinense TaxID=2970906 RepID=A0A4D8PU53_9PROT|nr:class I SAM-dependent methyltransferase [Azospirillum argentinense]
MHIDWDIDNTVEAPCPACADTAPKPIRLQVRSAIPPCPELPLVLCNHCGTSFFPTLKEPEYETAHATKEALAFYLEQGAGIDVMAEPLAAIDSSKVQRYLEIGCGFGFSLDFARSVFGWSVQGIDPGFAANFGREMLDLPIASTYLRTPADAGPEPFDLVLCSEVVEHVFEPLGFLEILRGVLAPGGTLLLTTPNAGAIAPDTPAGILVPLLSPGYHVTLYSRAGFEALLRRAGFTAVQVTEHGPTLRAAVSMTEGTADLSRRLDRDRYIDYLRERARTIAPDTPLGLGLRYRRLKELTHAGRFAEAEEAARQVVEACRARFGFDLDKPDELLAWTDWPADLAAFHARGPFSLCGILYCLGMLAWLHHGNRDLARTCFQAAAMAGEHARAVLQKIGADDGETDDLAWRARGYAAQILAWTNPAAAADAVERFETEPSLVLKERIPLGILADVRQETFTTLLNLGHYAVADRLALGVEQDLPTRTLGQTASVTFGLGILCLNHRKAAKMASTWFAKAHEASRRLLAAAPEQAMALLWPALYHQALALVQAKDKNGAAEAVSVLLDPSASPAVPPDIVEQAKALARTHRLAARGV